MLNPANPVVSVIIAVFNGERYVRQAIESVLSQTFKGLEIIVVDDGSTDGTKSAIDGWIADGTIRYFFQENKGLAAARNTGLRQARGEFLKFLDCDDWLYPEQLERQVRHLQSQPSNAISATAYELEFASGKKIVVDPRFKDDQLAQFIDGNPCPVHTILVSRKMVKAAGGFDHALRCHEDTDLWIRLLIQNGMFVKLDYQGCCYRIHVGALSDDSEKMLEAYCRFSEKLNRALAERLNFLSPEVLRSLYYKNLQTVHRCFSVKRKAETCLPVTLKVSQKLYLMKGSLIDKLWGRILGFRRWAWQDYVTAVRVDRGYAQKLGTIFWRDEKYYEWKKFRYWEMEPRNKKVKNILYLNSSAVIYGAETRLLDVLQKLDTDRFHPFVLLPHQGPLSVQLEALGVKTLFLQYGFPIRPADLLRKEAWARFLRLNRYFVRLVRKHDIDVIHANLHINMSKFWLAFLLLRLPVIVHMRSHFWLTAFEKWVICSCHKAIFVSRYVQRQFFQKHPLRFLMNSRPGHCVVLHDGIDVERFTPATPVGWIRKEFNISPEAFVVAIVGAVDKIKGPDLLLRAAPSVVARHPGVKFLIVGDLYHPGADNLAYRASLEKMAQDEQLKDKVIFMGFRHDIEVLMTEIDLLVQPSEREALGTSMVEAMACGKPVIGTDVDGIPEVIGDNESGILLKPRTPEALAEAINYFIENPGEARRRGERGRARVLELFNVYKNIQHVQSYYQDALKHRW